MTIKDDDRNSLINYRIELSHESIDEVKLQIEHNKLRVAINRIYYGMFYIVTALAFVLAPEIAGQKNKNRLEEKKIAKITTNYAL
jgi:uncharacterized protein (UPF0332 family)